IGSLAAVWTNLGGPRYFRFGLRSHSDSPNRICLWTLAWLSTARFRATPRSVRPRSDRPSNLPCAGLFRFCNLFRRRLVLSTDARGIPPALDGILDHLGRAVPGPRVRDLDDCVDLPAARPGIRRVGHVNRVVT